MNGIIYGSFDEMVLKYPWNFNINQTYIYSALLDSAITGEPLIINDGYFVLVPTLYNLISKYDPLFYELVRNNYIRILNRNMWPLSCMVSNMADNIKIKSYMKLYADKAKWKQVKTCIDMFCKIVPESSIIRWGDVEMGYYYERVLRTAYSRMKQGQDRRYELLDHAYKLFKESMETNKDKPRSKWESAVKTAVKRWKHERSENIRWLMGIGNQVYHFSFALAYAAEYQKDVGVETCYSDAFHDFIDVNNENILIKLPKMRRPRVPRYIPAKIIADVINGPMLKYKELYKNGIKEVINQKISENDFENIVNEYQAKLNDRMQREYEHRIERLFPCFMKWLGMKKYAILIRSPVFEKTKSLVGRAIVLVRQNVENIINRKWLSGVYSIKIDQHKAINMKNDIIKKKRDKGNK